MELLQEAEDEEEQGTRWKHRKLKKIIALQKLPLPGICLKNSRTQIRTHKNILQTL